MQPLQQQAQGERSEDSNETLRQEVARLEAEVAGLRNWEKLANTLLEAVRKKAHSEASQSDQPSAATNLSEQPRAVGLDTGQVRFRESDGVDSTQRDDARRTPAVVRRTNGAPKRRASDAASSISSESRGASSQDLATIFQYLTAEIERLGLHQRETEERASQLEARVAELETNATFGSDRAEPTGSTPYQEREALLAELLSGRRSMSGRD